jgi:hypothetical protein
MKAILNVTTKIVAFADQQVSSNPRLKYADWLRDISGIDVHDPKTEGHEVAAGDTLTVFNGVRTTYIDGTTSFTSSLSPLDPSRYRFTWGSGTNPVLRTGRSLTLNGIVVTVTVLSNATVKFTVPAGPDFTNVQVGDTVLIPGVATGDSANVFSSLNVGYWTVLAKTNSLNIICSRPSGTDFEAIGEAVTLSSNAQFSAFSTAGVQVGDSVDISAGFSIPTRRTFEVVAVTDTYFEVISTTPLAAETATPTATGMVFYTNGKNFLYMEANQDCVVRLNGSSDNSQRIVSIDPSNPDHPGVYMKWGPVWSLVVVNVTTSPLSISIIHAG